MSKAEGKKIGIKFTLPLVGDVEGNENAFTVSGQEYQYTDGPENNGVLVNKFYEVESVERYGILPLWHLEQSLKLDVLGELEIIDTGATQIASGTSASLSVNANAGDIVLATVSLRSASTVPTGWTEIYRSPVGGSNQYLVFATKEITTDGLVTYTATQSSSGRMMINLITVRNVKVNHAPEFTVVGDFTGAVSVPNKQVGEKLIWGVSANIWNSTGYNSWQTSPDDLQLVDFVSSDPPPRQANFIDSGEGEATDRTFIPSSSSETSVFISAVKLLEEVDSYKVEEISPIKITGQYRVRWLENKPTDTDITIEYTTGLEQGEWIEVSNGDVITSDTNLWFKVTLETTDTKLTPTLQDLWIEELDEPQDQIRLIMNDEFRNVQGNITINYNQALGNLLGTGGAVANFTETFTPTDLEEGLTATGGAYGTHEHIEASVGGSIEMIYITKLDAYHPVEYIKASVGGSIDLKHISEINP